MDKRKKKKIIILGLCIGLVALLGVYLGLFADREAPPFEISEVYSLPLGEDEKAYVQRVIVSDLTGDGRKEVLASYDVYSYVEKKVEGASGATLLFKEARVLILASDAGGNFQKLWEYDSGLTRQNVAVGDFDGDGKPDLVIGGVIIEDVGDSSASVTSRVEVLLQRENGGFDKVFASDIGEFFWPGLIEAGDFDGDGRTDSIVGGLAAGNESPYPAYLFRNRGAGNFTMYPIALRQGVIVMGMWKADINNDGSPDLIIRATDRDTEISSLILLLNDGAGEFEFRELDVSPNVIVIEDFIGNEYPDVVFTKSGQVGDEVYFLRNEQGEFAEPKPIGILSEGQSTRMISADFNNDNTLDVLLLEEDVGFREDLGRFETDITGHLLLIRDNDELSFTWEWSHNFLEEREISSSQHATVAADINDDGWTDLILVFGGGEVYLALNQHT